MTSLVRPTSSIALAATLALVAGCTVPPSDLGVPAPDVEEFAYDVYPILLADCGFPACHGDPDRFFAVYGPGRTRLSPASLPYDPPTAEEVALSYERARSMLVGPGEVYLSPLLMKPLAENAGGTSHEGDDAWGRAIFASTQDPRFETLYFWAISAEGAE